MSSKHLVHVRVKPTEHIAEDFIKLGEDGQSITVKSLKKHPRSFLKHQISSYSFAFASILLNTDQQTMFNLTTKPAIEAALNGTSGCIIACGGPKSGKTFTLNGPINDYAERGLIPRAIAYVFQKVQSQPELGISVRCSYTEFYNDQLVDVINAFNGQPQTELKIVEHKNGNITVKNLLTPTIKDEQSGLERLFSGNAQRALHPDHLFMTSVYTLWFDSDVPQPATEKPLHTKLHFVDMATTVKFNTSNRESEEFHRQANINRTMTVLERVLIAEEHIPYRSCPLTHFLKDSLPNRCLIAHVSFEAEDLPSTLGTLKFSARVQGETSDDILNLKEHKDSQIQRLQKEIDDMRAQLRVKNPQMPFCEPDRQERQILAETVQSYLSDAVPQFPVRSLYEVRAALQIMKEQYRSQKVSVEEQLREKYVFTVKPPEPSAATTETIKADLMPADEAITFFPLIPTEKELWEIYKSTAGEELSQEISTKSAEVLDLKRAARDAALVVNDLKAKIDELKAALAEKEKSRLPPIDGVLVIDEDELKVREDLRELKRSYKTAFAEYTGRKEDETQLKDEIDQRQQQLEEEFREWLAERNKKSVDAAEEEDDEEELLDKDERRERRELQRVLDQDPKAAPYFHAFNKIQKILEREFRSNGTRRQAVTEEE